MTILNKERSEQLRRTYNGRLVAFVDTRCLEVEPIIMALALRAWFNSKKCKRYRFWGKSSKSSIQSGNDLVVATSTKAGDVLIEKKINHYAPSEGRKLESIIVPAEIFEHKLTVYADTAVSM